MLKKNVQKIALCLIVFMCITTVLPATALAEETADFSFTPTGGMAPLTVHFTPVMTGIIRNWDFDGDGTTDSTDSFPTYTYTVPGTYAIKYNCSNGWLVYNATKNITIDPPCTCVVTFDPESGTVSPATQTKLFGYPYGKGADGTTGEALPVPARANYIFAGWWTAGNGEGSQVTDATVMMNTASHTLYAKWYPVSYTILYNGNGNTGGTPPDVPVYPYNETVTISGQNTLEKTGYSFHGWNTQKDGSGTAYALDQTFYATSSLVLYAQWIENDYTVTFDAEGGSVTPQSQVKQFGSSYGKASDGTTGDVLPIPVRDGFTFAGWWTGVNGTGNQVLDSTSVNRAEDHILFARWTENSAPAPTPAPAPSPTPAPSPSQNNTYTVRYDAGAHGSISGSDHESVAKGYYPFGVPAVAPDEGYRFLGWSSDGGQTLLNAAGVKSVAVTGNIAYTAYYTPISPPTASTDPQQGGNNAETGDKPETSHKVTLIIYDGNNVVEGADISLDGQSKKTDREGKVLFELPDGEYQYGISNGNFGRNTGSFKVQGADMIFCLMLGSPSGTVLRDQDGVVNSFLLDENGNIIPSALFLVEELPAGSNGIQLEESYASRYNILSAFYLALLQSGLNIQPGGSVRVGLPAPAGSEGMALLIVRINVDGTVTEFDTDRVGNMLFFTTDHFSTYAVLAPQTNAADAGAQPAVADSDVILPHWWMIAAVMLVLIVAVFFALWKRQNKKIH